MHTDNYVVKSLELHLFFCRIMKEHSLFLKAGFTPANADYSKKAEFFMKAFERLLCQVTALSNGVIGSAVINSEEIVTDFTALAERQTQKFTGIAINREITAKEKSLKASDCHRTNIPRICSQIQKINQTALRLLDGLISLKEDILKNVLCCEMFTVNYPLLIEHIIREAKLYRKYVCQLEKNGELTDGSMKETECFWNRIMMEHAQFIRGLLDPTETALFNSADEFAKDYAALLENCKNAHSKTLPTSSLEETIKFRDFKIAGTKGITDCKIRSIILPLLADHVLREANHYIRLLRC